jgi:hypothetical protein
MSLTLTGVTNDNIDNTNQTISSLQELTTYTFKVDITHSATGKVKTLYLSDNQFTTLLNETLSLTLGNQNIQHKYIEFVVDAFNRNSARVNDNYTITFTIHNEISSGVYAPQPLFTQDIVVSGNSYSPQTIRFTSGNELVANTNYQVKASYVNNSKDNRPYQDANGEIIQTILSTKTLDYILSVATSDSSVSLNAYSITFNLSQFEDNTEAVGTRQFNTIEYFVQELDDSNNPVGTPISKRTYTSITFNNTSQQFVIDGLNFFTLYEVYAKFSRDGHYQNKQKNWSFIRSTLTASITATVPAANIIIPANDNTIISFTFSQLFDNIIDANGSPIFHTMVLKAYQVTDTNYVLQQSYTHTNVPKNTTTTYTLNNLTAGTTYEVRAEFSVNNQYTNKEVVLFTTTTSSPGDNQLDASISIDNVVPSFTSVAFRIANFVSEETTGHTVVFTALTSSELAIVQSQTNGIVSEWNFDNSTTDLSGTSTFLHYANNDNTGMTLNDTYMTLAPYKTMYAPVDVLSLPSQAQTWLFVINPVGTVSNQFRIRTNPGVNNVGVELFLFSSFLQVKMYGSGTGFAYLPNGGGNISTYMDLNNGVVHIAVVYDPNAATNQQWTIYANGDIVAQSQTNPNLTTAQLEQGITYPSDMTHLFIDGEQGVDIHKLCIYNKALTQEEIQNDYNPSVPVYEM